MYHILSKSYHMIFERVVLTAKEQYNKGHVRILYVICTVC